MLCESRRSPRSHYYTWKYVLKTKQKNNSCVLKDFVETRINLTLCGSFCCACFFSLRTCSLFRTWSANASVVRQGTRWKTSRRRTRCRRSSPATSRTPSAMLGALCRTGTWPSIRASRRTFNRCVFVFL